MLILLAMLAIFGAGAMGVAALRWHNATETLLRQLPDQQVAPAAPVTKAELAGLPSPVARYFQFALSPGQPRVLSARIAHAGQFRSGGIGSGWAPFTSRQQFSATDPGFIWDARIRMFPLLNVWVRDSYLQGEGSMLGKVAGLFTVVEQSGTPAMAAGALHRWLAEAAWFPTALLPGEALHWQALDRTSARATLTDHATTVSLDYRFGSGGQIVGIRGERFRDVDGEAVRTPWVARFSGYRQVAGMMIPTAGEVGWVLPEGELVYWRGRITAVDYRFAGAE